MGVVSFKLPPARPTWKLLSGVYFSLLFTGTLNSWLPIFFGSNVSTLRQGGHMEIYLDCFAGHGNPKHRDAVSLILFVGLWVLGFGGLAFGVWFSVPLLRSRVFSHLHELVVPWKLALACMDLQCTTHDAPLGLLPTPHPLWPPAWCLLFPTHPLFVALGIC